MLDGASEAHLSFKTFLLPVGCGGCAGFFLSPFREEGSWECSCTISPLCARWDGQTWFHSSQHRFVSAPHLHLYLQSAACPEPKRSGTAQAEQGAFEARQAESLRSTSVHPHPQHHVHPRRLGNVGHGLFRGGYCTSCEHLERI